MRRVQSATSIEQSPEQERNARMRRYTIAMSVRMLCLVLGVFTEGLLMWIFFAAAIFLPYFAVVLANVQSSSPATRKAVAPTLSIQPDEFFISETDRKRPSDSNQDK